MARWIASIALLAAATAAFAQVDPAVLLHRERALDKWTRLWSEIFLGGKQVARDH